MDKLTKQEKYLTSKDLVIGDWYFLNHDSYIETRFLTCFNGDITSYSQYGFYDDIWDVNFRYHSDFKYTKATQEEVGEALINEAKKRGFKNNIYVNNSSIGFGFNGLHNDGDEITWNGEYLDIGSNRLAIFSKGKWAEIIFSEFNKDDLTEKPLSDLVFEGIMSESEFLETAIVGKNNEDSLIKESNSVLLDADRVISGERKQEYGDKKESFRNIAKMWSVIARAEITEDQVGLMMIALKLVRENNSHKHDNLVDICGYAQIISTIKK